MKNPLMWKLLRKHISKSQLVGFAIANVVGLTIVLLGIQFWQDVRPVFEDEDSFIRKDYLVVTKSIGGVSMVKSMIGGVDANAFSEDEIADLESQPWMRKVGRFSSTNYKAAGNISIGNRALSLRTFLFFESVPDEFIDTKNINWSFDPTSAHPMVPILLSKDYLSLYNFGFAASQGMPQLSEDMVGKVPIVLTITATDGHQEYIEGRVVGFSNRLNTIIVPEKFMTWSNSRFAPEVKVQPSRLILEVSKPGDVAIEKYMKKHGYEIAGDKMNSNKASYMLTVIMGIVIAVGLVISLLSFFILILSIYLLLQKNTKKLQDLLLLGYTPKQVAGTYEKMVIYVNAAVYVVAIALLLYSRSLYMTQLQMFSLTGEPVWLSTLVGLVVIGLISLGNIIAIRRKVASLWYLEK